MRRSGSFSESQFTEEELREQAEALARISLMNKDVELAKQLEAEERLRLQKQREEDQKKRREEQKKAEQVEVCSICTEAEGIDCITPCMHRFHRACVNPWVVTKETCPNCRTKVYSHELLTVVPPPAERDQKSGPEEQKESEEEEPEGDEGEPEVEDCSICQDNALGALNCTTPCMHKYHRVCIEEWLSKSETCPYCRSVVDPGELIPLP